MNSKPIPFEERREQACSMKKRLSPFGDRFIPSLQSLRLAMIDGRPRKSYLEAVFALELFVCSNSRRMNETAKGLALDAARVTVSLGLSCLAAVTNREGLGIIEPEGHIEALVGEMAESFPKLQAVRTMVANRLWEKRTAIFADAELTRSDPNVYVSTWHEYRNKDAGLFDENDTDLRITTEAVSATLGRTLDYIEHLKGTREYQSFFLLRRHLTGMWRVGEAVLGRDF